jgi:hypothetical protein
MIIAIILGALAVASIVGTLATVRNDGHGRIPTDWTRPGVF